MKWCCSIFEDSYKSAGERGAAILVGRDYFGKPEFTIQHRTVDIGITDAPITEYPMAWVFETRISYCPWCGRELNEVYGKEVDNLNRPELKIPDLKVADS